MQGCAGDWEKGRELLAAVQTVYLRVDGLKICILSAFRRLCHFCSDYLGQAHNMNEDMKGNVMVEALCVSNE